MPNLMHSHRSYRELAPRDLRWVDAPSDLRWVDPRSDVAVDEDTIAAARRTVARFAGDSDHSIVNMIFGTGNE